MCILRLAHSACLPLFLPACLLSWHLMCLQVHVPVQSHAHHGYSVVQTSAVAAGGRYDALLRNLWSPAAAAVMPAPGVGKQGELGV